VYQDQLLNQKYLKQKKVEDEQEYIEEQNENFIPMQQQQPVQPVFVYYPYFGVNSTN